MVWYRLLEDLDDLVCTSMVLIRIRLLVLEPLAEAIIASGERTT